MTEQGAEGTNTTESEDTASTTQRQHTNREVKDDPLFQKLAAEKKDIEDQLSAIKTADAEAKTKAEREKLESEGKYTEALEMREKELETLKTSHATELLQRDLTTELLKAGFNNQVFIDGALAQYNAEQHNSPAEYAAKMAGDEANQIFLNSSDGRNPLIPPSTPRIGGPKGDWTIAQIKDLQRTDVNGGTLENRQKVRQYLTNYLSKNGGLPEGL